MKNKETKTQATGSGCRLQRRSHDPHPCTAKSFVRHAAFAAVKRSPTDHSHRLTLWPSSSDKSWLPLKSRNVYLRAYLDVQHIYSWHGYDGKSRLVASATTSVVAQVQDRVELHAVHDVDVHIETNYYKQRPLCHMHTRIVHPRLQKATPALAAEQTHANPSKKCTLTCPVNAHAVTQRKPPIDIIQSTPHCWLASLLHRRPPAQPKCTEPRRLAGAGTTSVAAAAAAAVVVVHGRTAVAVAVSFVGLPVVLKTGRTMGHKNAVSPDQSKRAGGGGRKAFVTSVRKRGRALLWGPHADPIARPVPRTPKKNRGGGAKPSTYLVGCARRS